MDARPAVPGALAVARREWGRFRSTPRLWLLVVVAPVLLVALTLAVFVERTPLSLPLLVVDLDRSPVSHALVQRLDAAPALRVGLHPDLPAAAAAVRRGEAYAVLAVPPGLEGELLAGRAPRLQLYYNRQMMTAGNLVLREVRTVAATVGAGLGLARGVALAARSYERGLEVPPGSRLVSARPPVAWWDFHRVEEAFLSGREALERAWRQEALEAWLVGSSP